MATKKNKTPYPHFTHTRIDEHPIIGKCKVFHMDKYPKSTDCGSQTDFYTNGAEVDNPKQYGIKMFNTSIEAFAAYQRQKIAAAERLAPPVGMMVRFVIRDKRRNRSVNRWGYETCLADCSTFARKVALILSSPYVRSFYESFCRERNIPVYTPSSVNKYERIVNRQYDMGETRYAFGMISQSSPDSASLRFRLSRLSIVGTQYDDISEVYTSDSFHDAWKNPRLRLGETWNEGDDGFMFNDIHQFNIGLWKGECVCIDFGYHICCPSYRNFEDGEIIFDNAEDYATIP